MHCVYHAAWLLVLALSHSSQQLCLWVRLRDQKFAQSEFIGYRFS